jgi:hypothetical protein
VCKTWTCKTKVINVTFACDSPSGDKCREAACSNDGKCVDGPAKVCKDDQPCAAVACNPATGTCEATPDKEAEACEDNDLCTVDGVCAEGVCVGKPKCTDDACRSASCDAGKCSYVAKAPLPTTCDDGDLCTEADACVADATLAAKCVGTPIVLDCSAFDGECTMGACQPATGLCAGAPANEGAVCSDSLSCTTGDHCEAGICLPTAVELVPVLYENFSGSSNGWTIEGQWAMGPAVAGKAATSGFPDPGDDTSPSDDNGVAGIVLGGPPALTQVAPMSYLTSPVVDTSAGDGPVFLTYDRWLNSDVPGFMLHVVEVFDGTAWKELYRNTGSVKEGAWTPQKHDITAFRGPKTQVRFGYQLVKAPAFGYQSWNLDEIRIGSPACATGAGGMSGAGGGGAGGMSGGAGQGGLGGEAGSGGTAGAGGIAGAGGVAGAAGALGGTAGAAGALAGSSGAAGSAGGG